MTNYNNLAARPVEIVAQERIWCYASDLQRWYGDFEGSRVSEADALRAEIWWLNRQRNFGCA